MGLKDQVPAVQPADDGFGKSPETSAFDKPVSEPKAPKPGREI